MIAASGRFAVTGGNPLLFRLHQPAAKPIHEISAAKPPPGPLGARLGSFRNPPNFPPPPANPRPREPGLCSKTTAGVPQQANVCHSEARTPGRGICFAPAHNRFLASLGMTTRDDLSPRTHFQNQPPRQVATSLGTIPRPPHPRKDRPFGKIPCHRRKPAPALALPEVGKANP